MHPAPRFSNNAQWLRFLRSLRFGRNDIILKAQHRFKKVYSRSKFQRGSPRVKKFARNKFLTVDTSKLITPKKEQQGSPAIPLFTTTV